MDADEHVGSEASLESAQGDSHEVPSLSDVNQAVVIRRLDPVDVLDTDEAHAFGRPHDQSLERGSLAPARLREMSLLDLLLGALQCLLKPLVAEWLEQVIDGAGFESLNGISLVRGEKHGDR